MPFWHLLEKLEGLMSLDSPSSHKLAPGCSCLLEMRHQLVLCLSPCHSLRLPGILPGLCRGSQHTPWGQQGHTYHLLGESSGKIWAGKMVRWLNLKGKEWKQGDMSVSLREEGPDSSKAGNLSLHSPPMHMQVHSGTHSEYGKTALSSSTLWVLSFLRFLYPVKNHSCLIKITFFWEWEGSTNTIFCRPSSPFCPHP